MPELFDDPADRGHAIVANHGQYWCSTMASVQSVDDAVSAVRRDMVTREDFNDNFNLALRYAPTEFGRPLFEVVQELMTRILILERRDGNA